ncbi:hypothetical protein scyTo_0012801 [Scyliorhinus torazame]|uniref:Uncharacterized protein n=1 Tax=Scyliorhinus torazame TaxID=75743 RepID=A0A401NIU6_SCYTO|nr:hypothetical protein [Scyliorhinus torazame]
METVIQDTIEYLGFVFASRCRLVNARVNHAQGRRRVGLCAAATAGERGVRLPDSELELLGIWHRGAGHVGVVSGRGHGATVMKVALGHMTYPCG